MLEIENLCVGSNPDDAIGGVSLSVRKDGITALLGPNGAGKSALLRAVCGLAHVRSGRILLDGQDITSLPAHRRAARGLGSVLQGWQVFDELTVLASLRLAWRFGRQGTNWPRAIEQGFADFPTLAEVRDNRAADLTGPLQKQLMLLAATISAPSCLLLDEPSGGLPPAAQQEIYAHIADIRRRGTTVLLAEPMPKLPMQICDYGYVIRHGAIVAEGTARVLIEAGVVPALSTAYV